MSTETPANVVPGDVMRVLDGNGADITPRQGGYLHFME